LNIVVDISKAQLMTSRPVLTLACVAVAAAVLAGCSSSSAADTGRLRVVASTDVYGDIIGAVAGDHADITSFIDDPDQDPHSYEANARNQLAISKADLIVENGGGYDDFIDRMSKASGKAGATVVNVVKLSGKTAPAGGELNEHVWYDVATVQKLVNRLRAFFAAKDPADRSDYARNAAAFTSKLRALTQSEAAIRSTYAGRGAAITEPVPLYLLEACGLVNKTPPAFSQSVEEGTDVSASVLKQTLDLFGTNAVQVLVYNEQTSGAETTKVLAAAKAHHVPAVPVTETLPSGKTYLSWMRANLDAVRSALAAS
jgi:zinc/manganese transport system substrate-binding protein